MKRLTICFVVFSFFIFSAAAVETGETAPTFANMDLSGNFVLSNNVIGNTWVIVDFFATYCVPCKKEVPELEKLQDEFGKQNLRVFVMATDKGGKKVVESYFQKLPTSVTVLLDRYMVSAKRYGVKSIPTVFLIDKTGKIVMRSNGYSEKAIKQMRELLANASSE